MHENTLNDDAKVEALINSSISILSGNTPYTVVKTYLCERKFPLICVQRGELLYPLFALPTTEIIASVKDENGDPVFKLNQAN